MNILKQSQTPTNINNQIPQIRYTRSSKSKSQSNKYKQQFNSIEKLEDDEQSPQDLYFPTLKINQKDAKQISSISIQKKTKINNSYSSLNTTIKDRSNTSILNQAKKQYHTQVQSQSSEKQQQSQRKLIVKTNINQAIKATLQTPSSLKMLPQQQQNFEQNELQQKKNMTLTLGQFNKQNNNSTITNNSSINHSSNIMNQINNSNYPNSAINYNTKISDLNSTVQTERMSKLLTIDRNTFVKNIEHKRAQKLNLKINDQQKTTPRRHESTSDGLIPFNHLTTNSSTDRLRSSYREAFIKKKNNLGIRMLEEQDENIVKILVNEKREDTFQDQFRNKLDGTSGDFPNFLRHYKNVEKIQEFSNIGNENISPFTDIIKKSEENHMMIKKYGLFNEQGPNQKVKGNLLINGDKQGEIFSFGLNSFRNEIKELDLSSNNLSDKGMMKILENMGKDTEHINLSYNKVAMQTCNQLQNIIQSNYSQLSRLNLEGNNIGNKCAQVIIQGCLQRNLSLKYLNLSKNKLTHEVCADLKEYLIDSTYLDELYLHWNQIYDKGFKLIGEAMLENENLKVLDLSYNGIGGSNNMSGAQIWAKVFLRSENMRLLHLDFSYNKFNIQEGQIMAEGLEKNHRIYGFHYRGNPGKMTCKQFLRMVEEDEEVQHNLELQGNGQGEWQIMHRIEGVKVQRTQKYVQNCWICEGWLEMSFTWNPQKSGPIDKGPIYIHFDFDEWVPHEMKQQENGNFIFSKMCPPNSDVKYFYTAGGHQLVAQDHSKELHDIDKKIIVPFADLNHPCYMGQLNFKYVGKNYTLLDQEDYIVNTDLKPRVFEKVYMCPHEEEIEIPWSYENSLFRNYKRDESDLIKECFKFDWSCCKFKKVIKDYELNGVKEFIFDKYRLLKNAYKYYSCIQPIGDLWSVSGQAYLDFFHFGKIIDDLFSDADADFNLVACNSGLEKWKQQNNPPKALIRYQTIEALIRNVNDKEVKTKVSDSLLQGLNKIFDSGFEQFLISITDENEWKEAMYWTELVEKCIRRYMPIIEYVFQKFISKKNVIKRCWKLEDFQNFVNDTGMNVKEDGEILKERDINMAFNLSIMTQVDEITKNRHFEMYQIEFYEALARLADNYNFEPYGEKLENWDEDKRKNLPLHMKMESFLMKLFQKYINKDEFKEENGIQNTTIYQQELEYIKEGLQTVFVQNPRKKNVSIPTCQRKKTGGSSRRQSIVGSAIVAGFGVNSRRQSARKIGLITLIDQMRDAGNVIGSANNKSQQMNNYSNDNISSPMSSSDQTGQKFSQLANQLQQSIAQELQKSQNMDQTPQSQQSKSSSDSKQNARNNSSLNRSYTKSQTSINMNNSIDSKMDQVVEENSADSLSSGESDMEN